MAETHARSRRNRRGAPVSTPGNGQDHTAVPDTADTRRWKPIDSDWPVSDRIGPDAKSESARHSLTVPHGETLSAHWNEEAELGFSMLSDVKARPVEWLWRPYVPLRANTLFCGDSDVGKSKAIASIISTVTRGSPFPMTTDVTRALGNRVIR